MISRITQFDFIRVLSFLGILLCHSLFESAGLGWLGRYFALTFNFLFLILSICFPNLPLAVLLSQ